MSYRDAARPNRAARLIVGSALAVLLSLHPSTALAAGPGSPPPPPQCPRHPAPQSGRCAALDVGGGVARGDFNGDRFADLAVGVPDEDLGTLADAGIVHVIYGSAGGLAVPLFTQLWHQDVVDGGAVVLDVAQPGDHFGAALAAGDFDGDGFSDLAIGAPDDDLGCAATTGVCIRDDGAVNVLYGSPSGLIAAGNQVFRPRTPPSPVAGTSFPTKDGVQIGNDSVPAGRFGAALVWGNFGRGAEGDLAIGVPGDFVRRTSGLVLQAGAVDVVYGTVAGLTATGHQVWRQGEGGVLETAEAGDHFGAVLAAGRIDLDLSFDDLVVGVPDEDYARCCNPSGEPSGTFPDAGGVHVLYGGSIGLASAQNQFFHQGGVLAVGTALTAEIAETGDRFGAALAVGDFNGNLFEDLAVAVPGENAAAGVLHVLYNDLFGLTTAGSQLLLQGQGGIQGTHEAGDGFASALAANDFDRDGFADLAAGVPYEDVGTSADAGVVNVIYGASTGLTATGNQLWQQGLMGVQGMLEAGDLFGLALSAWDFDGNGFPDLAIGVPYEDVGNIRDAGVVNVLYGSTAGLGASGNQIVQQAVGAVGGAPEPDDHFGKALY